MTASPVLIISAVRAESALLRSRLGTPIAFEIGGREGEGGTLGGVPVRILTTGPGLVNTVQTLTAAIEKERPKLIIQTGCAGAFAVSGLGIGDVGIASEEIDAHLGLESQTYGVLPEPLPFPIIRFDHTELMNRYPLSPGLTAAATRIIEASLPQGECRVVSGPFLTVSTITATAKRAEQYVERYAPCMESMEGSGAAHVALHYGIPFLEIRSASNRVGKRNREDWNLSLAFERCGEAVYSLLKGDILSWIDH